MDTVGGITYFGEVTLKGKKVRFGIKDADRLERMCLIGRNDAGREWHIVNSVLADAERGRGVLVLDGFGKLSEMLIERLPVEARERLVYLDPSDAEYPFAFNALVAFRALPEEAALPLLSDAIASLYRAKTSPLIEWAARFLYRNESATFIALYELTAEPYMRDRTFGTDAALQKEFESLLANDAETADAVRQNGRYLAKDTLVRNLIGQIESKLDFEQFQAGMIIVLDLSRIRMFPTRIAPLSRLFVHALRAHAAHLNDTPALYIHECLRAFSESDVTRLFSERTIMTLLSDSATTEADWNLRKVALSRSGTVIAYAPSGEEATDAAELFFPYVTIEDLEKLESEESVVMLAIDSVRSRPFFARTLPIKGRESVSYHDIQMFSRNRYATSRRSVDTIFAKRYAPPSREARPGTDPGSFSNAFRSIFARNAQGGTRPPGAPAAPLPPPPSRIPPPPPPPPKADANKKPAEIPEEELKKMLHVDPMPEK